MAKSGRDPAEIIREQGLESVSDSGELEALAREVIEANPKQLGQYRAGETKLLNFFVGQIMKSTGGKAEPGIVREILGRLLG